LPKQEKVQAVSELQEGISGSSALLMTDYRGLKVSEITELRRNLRGAGTDYAVVKNTLFSRAAKEAAIEADMSELLAGPTAVAFVHQDPVATAKALVDFARTHKALEIKGGYVEGRVLNADQIQALSKVPPREVLISQMLGAFQSPISGFVGTLQGIMSEFVFTLKAVADKQGAA
jgi:large subunit ribosomal protein L10